MRYLKYILVVAVSLALFACGNKSTTTGTGVISLNGGNGGTTAGGRGGSITAGTVFGDLKFHAGGVVNASFSLPSLTPNFVNVSTSTTVVKTITSETTVNVNPASPAVGSYFILSTDNDLHFQTSSGPKTVTGLIVNAKLHLPNDNGHTLISNGIVVNGGGTVTSDGANLDLQSGALLQINPGGVVQTTLASVGAASGSLALTSTNGVVINQGTVEGSGTSGTGGAAGGASGGVTLHAATFLYNTGIINAKGGNSDLGAGGAGGAILLQAAAASVATSGTVDASGGNGATGGNGGSLTFSSGGPAEIGRVVVAGTVTSNGGTGSAGNGGNGGAAITLTSYSGGILVSATVTANGGEGKGAGSIGGNGCTELQLNNNVGSNTATSHEVSPEGIKVAGNISLNGGQGAAQGGSGGAISLTSNFADSGTVLPGFANVEFFGYQAVNLNGGASTGGNGGAGGQVTCDLSSPTGIVNVNIPAGGVINEVAISAKGGDANTSAGSGGAGGTGGTLEFMTPDPDGAADPARTLVTNSGGIDVSGGAGDIGGAPAPGSVTMSAYGNLTNSGAITARGGRGTTSGSAGGNVSLSSAFNVVNSGGIVVTGGDGSTGGSGGSVSVSSGNQTTTAGIAANGGNSLTGGNGGSGGTITLLSEYALTNRSSLNVARGSGGSSNSATNGTITIDGVLMATALPASGAI